LGRMLSRRVNPVMAAPRATHRPMCRPVALTVNAAYPI
jgi:hypothetical protein